MQGTDNSTAAFSQNPPKVVALPAGRPYNKPSQDGLFEHFSQIARSVKIPLILYSIPGRCGIEIGVETVRRLAEANPNIVSIKEAGGNSDRVSQLMDAVKKTGFTILSGDDPLTLSFMAVGAQGVISVASNIIPAEVCAMVRAFAEGKLTEALRIHQKYYPLFKTSSWRPIRCR